MIDGPDRSPTGLERPPLRRRRPRNLGKLPFVLGAGGVLVAVGLLVHVLVTAGAEFAEQAGNASDLTAPANAGDLLSGSPGKEVQPHRSPDQGGYATTDASVGGVKAGPAPLPQGGGESEEALRARAQRWQAYWQGMAEWQAGRHQLAMDALRAGMVDRTTPNQQGGGQQGALPSAQAGAGPEGVAATSLIQGGVGRSAVVPRPGTLDQGPSAPGQEYLQATVMPAAARYELKEGAFVPCRLEGGIISDAQGVVSAVVTRNVTDAAGNILIPNLSTLVGRYDERTGYAQDGLPVGFTRVIFPPAGPDLRRDSLSLGTMPGTDRAGNAGFRDQVDKHTGRILLNAVVSALSGGAGRAAGLALGTGAAGIVGSSVGLEVGQAGQQLARGGVNTGSTIRIRPGYGCGIRLTKDIAFPGSWLPGAGFVR